MADKISYKDKEALSMLDEVDEIYKVTARNMNEIKNVVNKNSDILDKDNKDLKELNNKASSYFSKTEYLEQEYEEQIKNLSQQEPQLPEIVNARQGFETLGENIKRKIYYFDNVDSMKKARNLTEGDCVRTLGYYEANDGGAGEYKIIMTTKEDDGGSIIKLDNGLSAELIAKNKISVKQFGAKGDGIQDDTEAIQNLYNYIDNMIKENPYKYSPIVEFIGGKYLVSSKITIPIYIKTNIIGNVAILSSVSEGATISYTNGNKNKISGIPYLYSQGYIGGDIIGTSGGSLAIQRANGIVDINLDTSNSVGLEISTGDISQENRINLARCNFNNIGIYGFTHGLKIYLYDTYLLTFNTIRTEYNRYGITLEHPNVGGMQNAGENMSFNNCVISHCYNGLVLNAAISGVNFNQCSFDFNGNHILEKYGSYNLINFNSCHLEGVGLYENNVRSDKENTEGFGYVVYRSTTNLYSKPTFVFNDCWIHLSSCNPANNIFGSAVKGGYTKLLRVVLNNCVPSYTQDTLNFDNRFFADENTEIQGNLYSSHTGIIPYQFESDDKVGKFDTIENSFTGDYRNEEVKNALNELNYSLNVNTWGGRAVNLSIDTSDKVFNKALNVQQLSNNTYNTLIRYIHNVKDYVQSTIYAKLGDDIELSNPTEYDTRINVVYTFYDNKDKVVSISQSTIQPSVEQTYSNDNNWLCVTTAQKVPLTATYVKIQGSVVLKDKTSGSNLTYKGTVKFGGIIVC